MNKRDVQGRSQPTKSSLLSMPKEHPHSITTMKRLSFTHIRTAALLCARLASWKNAIDV